MRLGKLTNMVYCETEMQEKMAEWLNGMKIPFKREVYVKTNMINRIADFLIYRDGKGLINIEAKCNDFACMLRQMSDHARYCDYSFAYIPDYPGTPKWFKNTISKKGYGLIVFNYSTKQITEVYEAHYNRPTLGLTRENMIQYLIKNCKQ